WRGARRVYYKDLGLHHDIRLLSFSDSRFPYCQSRRWRQFQYYGDAGRWFYGHDYLSVSGLSNDATAGFSPPSIVINDVSAKSAMLTINTTAATPPGTY